MEGMTTQERYNDICKICGLSEDIVRRVLNAERQSVANSLKRGERATLVGRVTIRPELRYKLGIGGEQIGSIKLKTSVSSALAAEFDAMSSFISDTSEDNSDDRGIVLRQIPSLI